MIENILNRNFDFVLKVVKIMKKKVIKSLSNVTCVSSGSKCENCVSIVVPLRISWSSRSRLYINDHKLGLKDVISGIDVDGL